MKYLLLLLTIPTLLLSQEWENFTTENSGIPHNQFYGMALDSKNNLWLGTLAGLVKFDGETWTVFDTTNSDLPSMSVSYINIDKNDVLWSSATGNYAFNFDGIKWNLFKNTDYNLFDFQAYDIEFDYGNRPWYATSRFVKYYDNGNWRLVKHGMDEVGFSQVNCVEMDKKDVIWFGTETDGLFNYYNSKLTQFFPFNSDIPTGRISSLAIDSLNNVWIGTHTSQIAKFEVLKDKWTVYDITPSSFRKHIEQIRVDKNGDIWASSALKLLHFDGSKWDTLHLDADTTDPGRPFNITNFIFNKFGNIWVECDGSTGLYKYTRNPETSVESDLLSKSINLYPNPVKENLTLELDKSILIDRYRVVNTVGKIVREENELQNNPSSINLKTLETGTYFIEFFTKDGLSIKEKFIKE